MFVTVKNPSLGWLSRLNRGRLGTLQQVMGTITTTEAAKNSLNNPGNVIYVGQVGATPSSNCFTDTSTGKQDCIAQFDTLTDGTTYLTNLIQADAASGMTIQQFTNKYAPAGSGNNPTAYAQYIANATGLSIDDPLSAAISAGDVGGSSSGSVGGNTGTDSTSIDTGYSLDLASPMCDPTIDPTCGTEASSGVPVDWGVVGMAFAAVALIMIVSGR